MTHWRALTSTRRAHCPAVLGALPRPRLIQALGQSPLLLITAPAGYGKTTMLASSVPALSERVAWLTLDSDDADPQVLAAGLALAAEALPGGEAVSARMDAGASPRQVAARLADTLDACRGLLVLDEAQFLGSLSSDVLRELLDCGLGRVALLSRTALPSLEVARLEAAGAATRLSAADLAFTEEELAALCRLHGLHPSVAEVRLAHSLTEGWPIAARYLAQAAAQGRVRLADLAELDGGEAQLGTLFEYLAQEVLGPLAAPLQDVLRRGSVFDELTPELLREVLNLPDGTAKLEALAGATFLTRSGTEAVYRAHPLLRAHLRRSLAPGEVQALAASGAAFFERTGRPRRAVAAHLLAAQPRQAAALLAQHGAGWLALGRATLVERTLARLPQEIWTPQLRALAGDALRLSSRYDEALSEYAQATPLTRALGEAQVHLDTVQPDLAWAPLEVAQQLATGEQAARVRRLLAENLLNAGRLPEALALEPALSGGARFALRTGDLRRALELSLQAARGEAGGARAAQNHREGLLLASWLQALLGQGESAAQQAHAGLAEGERLGSPFVCSLALARLGHAQLVLGAEAAAEAAYQRALALARSVAGRLRVEPLMGLAFLAARSGDTARAAELEGEAAAQVCGDMYMLGLLRLVSALGHLQGGRAHQGTLDAAQAAFETSGDAFGQAAVALARFAVGDGGAQAAAKAVARYPHLLGAASLLSPWRERARRAALLAQLAAAAPELRGSLSAPARDLGYPALPTPDMVPGFEVQVQVLGRVSVKRSGEDRSREWGRAKARDLLLLLCVQEEGLSREAAKEALFPEAEPGVGERNFRVTLHALGQVLEEGAAGGAFLERGEWLRLRPGPDLHVDLHAARAALARPGGAPGRLETLLVLPAALADSDVVAAQQEAERYAARLPDALAEEAHCALLGGELPGALRAAERALALDPAHEPAARTLMRVHHAQANGAALRRVYAQLESALDRLGLRPLRETQLLCRALGG